jgi:hypothetical protein
MTPPLRTPLTTHCTTDSESIAIREYVQLC